MIELRITGECKGCPGIDLKITTLYCDGLPAETRVSCKNAKLCGSIAKHLRSALEGGKAPCSES